MESSRSSVAKGQHRPCLGMRWLLDLQSGVNVGTLLLTLSGVLAAGGVGWGSLLQRVRTLEREVAVLSGFAERLTRIEEQTGFIRTAVEQITGSWLFREPPEYDHLGRPAHPRK